MWVQFLQEVLIKFIVMKVEFREYRGYTVKVSKRFFNVMFKDGTYHSCRSMTQAKRYIDALIECDGDPNLVWENYRNVEDGEW